MSERGVAEQLLDEHTARGGTVAGDPIELRPQQTLTPDGTGVVVLLELEALGIERVSTERSVQYIDHNLMQEDHKNADDHVFLRTAAARYGMWFSPAGNGISHVVHQERFGRPGQFLLGADSHTPAAGALGMLALGAGGLDVALAMAGEPVRLRRPEIWAIELVGELRPFVSAKDVALELLRRHGVTGGRGRILEYHGPGLAALSVMDRHVLCNMGTELGAVTSVFPSDEGVDAYLRAQGRPDATRRLVADAGARYDHHERLDLSSIQPLVALPSSPGNVVPVADVAGTPIGQAYLGSSANPGFRDLAVPARIVAASGRRVDPAVSFDVNPPSRRVLRSLIAAGDLLHLVQAGGRLHQTGCNGCVGMGQAPATGVGSIRTTPRNFPGRSGTAADRVFLASPETVVVSALAGRITDPRRFAEEANIDAPVVDEPPVTFDDDGDLVPPLEAGDVEVVRGPNIRPIPELDPLPSSLELPVLLVAGDDVSTDEILPAGTLATAFRANVPASAPFAFQRVDASYSERAERLASTAASSDHVVVGGHNFGQGSAREHAALVPRSLGLRVVVAISIARIYEQNLANFGVLPLVFTDPADHARLHVGAVLSFPDIHADLLGGRRVIGTVDGIEVILEHHLVDRQVDLVRIGGAINLWKQGGG